MLLTDKPGRQNYWVILLAQLKWCRLYLTFSYSHFYFSILVLCDYYVLSITRHTEELCYHFYFRDLNSLLGSSSKLWTIHGQSTPGYVSGNCEIRILFHISAIFTYWSSVTIWLCLYFGPGSHTLGKIFCKLFFILCQMNSIQPNPIFSAGFHKMLTPFTERNVF